MKFLLRVMGGSLRDYNSSIAIQQQLGVDSIENKMINLRQID